MKLRHGSFLYSLVAASALVTVACSSSGSGNPGDGGSTGAGGMQGLPPADNLISNFEDTLGTVVHAGTPERNGYWYSYNDGVSGCVQVPQAAQKLATPPIIAGAFETMAPPTVPGNGSGSTLAAHSTWNGCSTWGAGIGADLNQPPVADGGTYDGPKVAYDVSAYKGLTFWAMAASGSETHLRVKVNMSDETKEIDGGLCKEDGVAHQVGKCSDAYGQVFTLPSNGSWLRVNVDFSDRTKFKQEGWGDAFPWDPTHVVSVQIQSTMTGEAYDLWVDDMYFVSPN
jgi:hypothetical protein